MSFYSYSLGNFIHFHGFNYHLQKSPQSQSETPTSLLNFSLNCPNVIWKSVKWIFCCHFRINVLKLIYLSIASISVCWLSSLYNTYFIQSSITDAYLHFSLLLSQGYIFFSQPQSSHNQNSLVYPCLVWGDGT